MRGAGKRLVERALARLVEVTGFPGAPRPGTLVLAYHNVVPHACPPVGERALHLEQAQFCEHLDRLARVCEVVPLGDVLSNPRSATRRPRVVVTWDDGYRGAVTVGVEEVARRGLPATIFVCPGRLGDDAFWWDRVAARSGNSLDPAKRQHLIEQDRGQLTEGQGPAPEEPPLPSYARTASEAELEAASRVPGVTIGSHSMTHPNLTRVDDARLRWELAEARAWLRSRSAYLDAIAYPYGLHDSRVRSAALREGYRAGLQVAGGWWRASANEVAAIPRLNVPAGLSAEGLVLRLSNLFVPRPR